VVEKNKTKEEIEKIIGIAWAERIQQQTFVLLGKSFINFS